jgi:outer membrane protein assembly factor BamE (lipoprotein component of BamABCDE complex)
MKKIAKLRVVFLLVATSALSACVYKTNVDYGTKFTKEQVSNIEKKVTTENDLIRVFGEPSIKTVISETGEKWVYSYTGGSASSQAFTMKTTSEISTHTLDILLENGVVVNFAETINNQNMNMSAE